MLPGVRAYATATLSLIGLGVAAYSVNNTSFGGYYLTPLQIPICMDVSRPSSIFITIGRLAGAASNTTTVVFNVVATILRPLLVVEAVNFLQVWTPPPFWLILEPTRVLLDDGTGVTFPAHTFQQGDQVGFRLARQSNDVADDYPNPIVFPFAAEYNFASRCPQLCC